MVRYRSVVDLPTHWHFYYENIILLVMIYICLGQNMLRFFFMNKEKTVSKLRKVTMFVEIFCGLHKTSRSTTVNLFSVSFPYDLHILATLKKSLKETSAISLPSYLKLGCPTVHDTLHAHCKIGLTVCFHTKT